MKVNDNEILLNDFDQITTENEIITKGEENDSILNQDDIIVGNSSNSDVNNNNVKSILKTPFWVWIVLTFALFSMSSAATVLLTLDRVPPLLKASWRLQSTSVFLFIGVFYDLNRYYKFIEKFIKYLKTTFPFISSSSSYNIQTDEIISKSEEINKEKEQLLKEEIEEIKLKLFQRNNILLILVTGIILGFHFAFWVTSLNETTLSHSLLFVTSSPIMVIIVMIILRKPISKGEIFGSLIGFIGLLITLLGNIITTGDSGSGDVMKPTFFGDLLALLGAACIVFYLFVGQKLRQWLPLFFYAFPVTFIASLFLTVLSLIFEDKPTDILPGESFSIVGWLSKEFIWKTLYLAIFPGLFGHTGVNGIIKYIEPVIISVTLLLEPPLGSLMGFIIGVSGLPDLFTFIGGPIIIIGCLIVTISSNNKNKTKE